MCKTALYSNLMHADIQYFYIWIITSLWSYQLYCTSVLVFKDILTIHKSSISVDPFYIMLCSEPPSCHLLKLTDAHAKCCVLLTVDLLVSGPTIKVSLSTHYFSFYCVSVSRSVDCIYAENKKRQVSVLWCKWFWSADVSECYSS